MIRFVCDGPFFECESEALAFTVAAIHQNELRRKSSRHHYPASFFSPSAYRFTTSSILVPKSFNITTAAFLPGPPVTEPPGCVVAPVWYKPGIGMRCCAYPGIGRIAPDCAGPDPPAWQLPCQLCGFIRSRSKGLSIVRARILSSVRFGEKCRRNFKFVSDTFCLIASQCSGPSLS